MPCIIRLHERPAYWEPTAQWFHQRWNVPLEAYRESMRACISGKSPVPAWYLCLEGTNIIGGLGEAVCACVAEHCPVPVKRIGVQDTFGHSGPAVDLLKQFGLCADNIASVTRTFVGK